MESNWQRRVLRYASECLEKEGDAKLAVDLKRIDEIGDLNDMDAFRDKRLHTIFENFDREDESHEISALLKEVCGCLGLKNVTFFVLREPRGKILSERVFTTYDELWADCYLSNRFWQIDPVVEEFFRSGNNFFWNNLAEKEKAINPALRRFFQLADEFDVGKNGFTRYFDFSDRGAYAFTITSDKSKKDLATIVSEHWDDTVIIARYFVDYLLDDEMDIDALVGSLRDDEVMILRLMASGMEERSIMNYIGIGSEIFDIVTGIKRKFGANTIQQAIYTIAKSNDVRVVPPSPHEIRCFS